MPQLCIYLQLHQPYRLGEFDFLHLGSSKSYFEHSQDHNRNIFTKVAAKSYLPMLSLLLHLVTVNTNFKFALSCSGVFLDQAKQFSPQVMELLRQLAKFEQVEFLAETYYHSLAGLFSEQEFERQVLAHTQLLQAEFNRKPSTFRNTELVYSNHLSWLVKKMGFNGMLTEAVPRYLGDRAKTQLFRSYTDFPLPLLLKHAELSDDVAFRFSDRNWHHFPLHSNKYIEWLKSYQTEEIINLFMDFETFGEHQWEDTGIFQFFESVVHQVCADQWSSFVTPGELFDQLSPKDVPNLPIYDVPDPISWADVDRDLTAWLENDLQQDTITQLYALEKEVLASNNPMLIEDWRKLQTSDHFYYMCTKWSADGDVHAYFSPFESPLEAYRQYSIVLADLKQRMRRDLS